MEYSACACMAADSNTPSQLCTYVCTPRPIVSFECCSQGSDLIRMSAMFFDDSTYIECSVSSSVASLTQW